MAIVENFSFTPLDQFDDPDDYRPNSELALIIDPGDSNGTLDQMVVFKEHLGVGDTIPLHQHTIAEVLIVEKGSIRVSLGNFHKAVKEGSVVFIPAKVPHGFKNIGTHTAHIIAVFPSDTVDINYLERNPAPGTENHLPQKPMAIHLRTLLDGTMQNAIKPVPPSDYN